MQRKGNPSTLLVGMQTSVDTVAKSMEFLSKLKMELPFDQIPLLRIYIKNCESPIPKNLCTLIFIVALFIVAKCWKQPKCPSVNERIKKTVVHLHHGRVCSRKKGAPTFCNSMDGTEEYYAK